MQGSMQGHDKESHLKIYRVENLSAVSFILDAFADGKQHCIVFDMFIKQYCCHLLMLILHFYRPQPIATIQFVSKIHI